MADLVKGPNVSAAWVDGLDVLLSGDGEAVNFTVAIADPTTEEPEVRKVLDAFIDDRRAARKRSIERVSTVANTIFPESWYVEHLGEDAEKHLYELEIESRSVTHLHRGNKRGTYFERFVAWPGPDGQPFNQLAQVVHRLRSAHERGQRRGNSYEIGITTPADEAVAAPVIVGGHDRQIMGFPCLSHASFSLQKGVVHLAAIYRSHEFINRGYGNYVGLGRLLRFVAVQSGWPVGELACMSASVTVHSGAGFGRGALTELLAECRRAQERST
jgi:thymidylate synthase